ncbi:MAG: RDD family protein [Deltaproteobacteria bacterium]|nr:RDD family protein [Deltaproteobacteria bacterium]MCZ6622185.1 RDD family protein [Deltaproteobacteria bacterium]MCZ6906514.1 RDD family protein [Deltaproteobacteria bacterium]
MKCPKCEYVTFDDLDRCKRCGASWVSERARFGVKDLSAPAERGPEGSPVIELVSKSETPTGTAILEHRLDEEFDRLYVRLKDEELKAKEVPWAGFFRRSCAFYIDVAILYALSSFLFYLTYVAYTVGLAAHGQVLDLDHLGYFLRILFFTGLSLVGGYFVLLHGMDGRTVGKWLLGLRVVSVNRTPITYGQALARLFGTIPAAFFGLGFFWILVNREKRGWHDILARTWVIKD